MKLKNLKPGIQECFSKKIFALMEIHDKIDLLKSEYFKLQDYYESFDSKAQTIKGWSATVSIAAITFGFSYKNEYIWLFASMTALVFWVMEAKWKLFQYCYSSRIKEIEKAFKENNFESIIPLQIYTSWFASWRSGTYKIKRIIFMNIVMMPYAYVIFICLVLFFLKLIHPAIFWK
jgi:uncharacterized membrane protein